jgi:hypothetical protein
LIALVTRGREVSPRDCLGVGADAAMLIDNVNRDTFLMLVRRVMEGLGPIVAGFPLGGGAPRSGHRRRGAGVRAPSLQDSTLGDATQLGRLR